MRPLANIGFLLVTLFTLLFISGCPETIRTVTGPTVTNLPPLLVSNQAIAFTYNSNDSFVLYNRGGLVENCHLFTNGVDVTNVLPLGLSVDVSNGECVLRGRSSNLTLSNGYNITSLPIAVESSNGIGISRVVVNVSVEPRYYAGDLSYGLAHSGITDIPSEVYTTYFRNGSNLIYRADAIPFASGGTGAYDDPVIIGIDAKAEFFSFVIDYNDVVVPVDNFSNRTNLVEQNFHINFISKSEISLKAFNTLSMDAISSGFISFDFYKNDDNTFDKLLFADTYFVSDGVGDARGNNIINTFTTMRLQFRHGSSGGSFQSNLKGVVRFSMDFE